MYVDDIALLQMAMSTAILLLRIVTIMTIAYDVFTTCGLTINFKAGKSEVLVDFRGEGSMFYKDKIFNKDAGRLAFETIHGTKHILITKLYKHVGGMIAATGSMHPETTQRAASAMVNYAPLSVKVFGDPRRLPVETRVSLADSLLNTRLFFNCQVWMHLTTTAAVPLHKVTMRIARRICNRPTYLGEASGSDISVLKRGPDAACR